MRRFPLFVSAIALMMTIESCALTEANSDNPLLAEWTTSYGVPPFDKILPKHYLPAFEEAIAQNCAEIDAIVASTEVPTFDNVVLAYDNSGKLLTDIYNVYGMITSAETNSELQALDEQIIPMLSAHFDQISLNEGLFNKVKTVYDKRETLKLDAEQMRLTEKIYDSFVRGGALLSSGDKAKLQKINEELSLLGVRYGRNLLAENNAFRLELELADLEGLPNSVRTSAKDTAKELGLEERWVFTLQAPSWIPFVTYSDKRELREKIYKAYISRGNHDNENDNKQIINDMVRLRIEKAQLLGFDNYAEYVISDQMAQESSKVYDLLEAIWSPALASAKEEQAEMEKLFKRDNPGQKFESWDWWYYAEKVRKKNYNLDEETLKPYFSLPNVQNGIFTLANRLYGITFRPVTVPRYHDECSAYEVIDSDNSHIGILYFDFHPRAGKGQGAWCGNYREQRYENGERIAPVLSVVCNFSRPSGSIPALLTIDETETLFHEFGHALHFLFHDVKYRGLSEVEGDFVELPSQIMENWAFEPEMLAQYAFHYRTNEAIPQSLIDKITRSRLFNQGFMTTELVAAALSDLDIHSLTEYEPFDVMEFEHKMLNDKRGLISTIEPRYHYPYFSHIFDGGYSAGYYFYLWAEILDQDAFAAFKQSGDIFNKKMAESFRRNLLERGGSASGMDLYTKFRGCEPTQDAMLISRGLMEPPVVEVEEAMINSQELNLDSLKRLPPIKKTIEKQ